MTNEQINWAITQAIGADPHWKCAKDYCTDLNAMHEAEKMLVSMKRVAFDRWIQKAVDQTATWSWHATARQRAEAFLRTLGKWEPTTEESSAVQKEAQS